MEEIKNYTCIMEDMQEAYIFRLKDILRKYLVLDYCYITIDDDVMEVELERLGIKSYFYFWNMEQNIISGNNVNVIVSEIVSGFKKRIMEEFVK